MASSKRSSPTKAFLFYVYEGGSESSLTELVADPCLVAAVDRFITGECTMHSWSDVRAHGP